jgi:hypothetical protein
MIAPLTLGEEYKLGTSSCDFPRPFLLLLLKSKYSPHLLDFKYLQAVSFPWSESPSFISQKNKWHYMQEDVVSENVTVTIYRTHSFAFSFVWV